MAGIYQPSYVRLSVAAATAAGTPVDGDGACFFRSVVKIEYNQGSATFADFEEQTRLADRERDRTVAYMRQHREDYFPGAADNEVRDRLEQMSQRSYYADYEMVAATCRRWERNLHTYRPAGNHNPGHPIPPGHHGEDFSPWPAHVSNFCIDGNAIVTWHMTFTNNPQAGQYGNHFDPIVVGYFRSQMDEQVFLPHGHGYAIAPARSLPVGLVEAVQAQHSAALLMAGLVVQIEPLAWAAIGQLPEMHRTVPTRKHGQHAQSANSI
jgi:hypothetical protein